jgi:hypothetical protein
METTPKFRQQWIAEHVRSVGLQERGDLHAVEHGIEARRRVRLRADRIDAGVRSASAGQLLDAVVNILLHEIERLGARRFRHGEPLAKAIA